MRRLCAILFTDIVGSTATMQADEVEARRMRDRHREAVEASVARWTGEVVQFYGDGSLSIFDSAVGAVRCAREIQHSVRADPAVPLRIGVHSGDIVHDEDGVFGDSVNVAARLESLCAPGAVLLSGKVHDEIKNQRDLRTVALGTFHLRNVARPTEVHAIDDAGLVVPTPEGLSEPAGRAPASVAVLPFVNMTSDPENAWFADGLAEDVISALTHIAGLKVTARTSSFAFRDRREDVRKIGEALGVATVLEGSMRRSGDRVRLTAQLVDARDGFHLFSEVYDRTLDDVFAVQDELARTIVEELAPRLLDAPSGSRKRPTVAANEWKGEAYHLYLRARAAVARWTPDSMLEALDFCQRSVTLDGTRAEPHATIATAYVFLGSLGHLSPDEAYGASEAAVVEALRRDPGNATALTNRAFRQVFADGNGPAALQTIERALATAPGLAFAHQAHAYVLLHERRFDEAVAAAESSVELDPLSPPLLNTLGTAYMTADRLAEARDVLERALAIAPTFRAATQVLAWTFVREGDFDRAIELMDTIPLLAGFEAASAGPRGYLYARSGRADDARDMLSLVRRRQIAEPHLQLHIDQAMIHLGLNELDAMFDLLESAAGAHPGGLHFLRWAGLWDDVRDHPRMQALLAR